MGKDQDTIKLKNVYFEELITAAPNRQAMFSSPFSSLLDKKVFPGEFKPGYWLGRVFDKIIQEMNKYVGAKQKLIREYTKKHEKNGQKKNKEGKIIKKWEKGDPISLDNGSPDWTNFNMYLEKLNKLQATEIDLGIRPIAFDPEKGPDVTGREMLLLIPLLKEPVENGKVIPFKKK